MKKKWLLLALVPVIVYGGWRLASPETAVPSTSASASITTTTTTTTAPTAAVQSPPAVSGKDGYQLGERLSAGTTPKSGQSTAVFKETEWESLIPKSWDPLAPFKGLDMDNLDDADPRAIKALQNLRASWDNAPIEPALNGAPVRIAGFIVPIDSDKGHITQFLLVPYFGACIHSPAPPLNQVIEVTPTKPTTFQMMEAVWISGTLETTRAETVMGNAGYRMRNATLARYEPKQEHTSSQKFE